MKFIGKTLWRLKIWILVFDLGVMGGWVMTTQYSKILTAAASTSTSEPADGKEEPAAAYIQGLSAEFAIAPSVVRIVDRYSKQYLAQPGPEWRLLQTPEFLTYLMLSIIHVESNGDPQAIGDRGRARGLTQIWTTTAQDYGPVTALELLDPETNIKFGFMHFHSLLRKYDGNIALSLYAWNRGSGTIDKLLAYGRRPENDYGPKVYSAGSNEQLLMGN